MIGSTPIFISFLLERYYHGLRTLSAPFAVPMYSAVTGFLGGSRYLVLYAPFCAVVRPFVDTIQAHDLAIYLVMTTGTVCLYAPLRTHVRAARCS